MSACDRSRPFYSTQLTVYVARHATVSRVCRNGGRDVEYRGPPLATANVSSSPEAYITLVRTMSLDGILYDVGRIASKAYIQIPCMGLDVWILVVRIRSESVTIRTDQTVEWSKRDYLPEQGPQSRRTINMAQGRGSIQRTRRIATSYRQRPLSPAIPTMASLFRHSWRGSLADLHECDE
jgi:hypothetical protein